LRASDGSHAQVLLFARDPSEILLGRGQEFLELAHAILADVACLVRGAGAFKKPDCFLVVGFGHVECVFEGGFVLKRRFFVHATSLVRFPG
jgi:hypothetical protein